jgi:hypothetical protein
MYKNLSKEELVKVLEGAESIHVEVEDFKKGNNRNSYFDKHDNLYEQMMEDIDNLTFFEDKVSMLRNNHSYNHSSTLSEIFNCILHVDFEDIKGYNELNEKIENDSDDDDYTSLDDMTLQEIQDKYPDFYAYFINVLDGLTEENLDVYNDGSTVFDCNYVDEVINSETYERLAYWTIYFEPDYKDVDIATQVGLTPFEYDGTFYLALGGCGMDLSPKLDAYVALVYGRIPKDSLFFSDRSYFEYVVGKHAYDSIIKKCKLEKQQYNISLSFGETKEEVV